MVQELLHKISPSLKAPMKVAASKMASKANNLPVLLGCFSFLPTCLSFFIGLSLGQDSERGGDSPRALLRGWGYRQAFVVARCKRRQVQAGPPTWPEPFPSFILSGCTSHSGWDLAMVLDRWSPGALHQFQTT